MKSRDRICATCKKVEHTASKSKDCAACYVDKRKARAIEDDRKLMESLYLDVSLKHRDHHGKNVWGFTHAECGTRQEWVIGNIKKQLKLRPDSVPCSRCGGKERMAKAMEAFVEKYGRDFDVALWEEYRTKARRLTEQTYKKYKFEINPLNLKRGYRTYHLDHMMPIIEGFLQGIPVEVIAAKENLQILPALTNMSKGRKHEMHVLRQEPSPRHHLDSSEPEG